MSGRLSWPVYTNGVSRFGSIAIRGFRRLADVELELRPFSVLIGANGIGKTSLLDVFSLLANSAQGSLNATISEMGGLPVLMTYDHAKELDLRISMEIPSYKPLRYLVRIRPQGPSYVIEEEVLSQERQPELPPFKHIDSHEALVKYFDPAQNRLVPPTWEHNPLETSLSQVPKTFREPEDLRRKLASSTFYHVLNVEPRSPVRLPQPMRPAALPGKNGEDLVSCLFYLRETERERFETIEDGLRAAFSGLSTAGFSTRGSRHARHDLEG